MKYDFSDSNEADDYLKFSLSDEGVKQHNLIWENLNPLLPATNQAVLDIGCGTGWLTGLLAENFPQITGIDSSAILLDHAKKNYPKATFVLGDINNKLPFTDGQFDLAAASLVLHDLPNLKITFQEISRIIKPGGSLFVIELNPYYAHPVGIWKRSLLWKKIFQLNSYFDWKRKTDRSFSWNNHHSLFYTLPEMINTALSSGFELKAIKDVESEHDSENLDIQHRSFHFPIFILYQFLVSGGNRSSDI